MHYWTMSPVLPLLITKLFLVETYIIQFRIRPAASVKRVNSHSCQRDFDLYQLHHFAADFALTDFALNTNR